MLRPLKSRSSRAALCLLAGTLLLGACSDASEEGDTSLDTYLCSLEDLGGDYQEQVSGSFSSTDLGGLEDGTEERKQAYRDAGLQRGRFIFWKEVLPKPPFDPPHNVVCQVLVFETNTEAQAWVADLEADSSEIAASGIVWLPDGERDAEEVAANEGRAFHVIANEGPASVELWATYEVRDNLVLSVFAGDREGRLAFADVREIQAARNERLNGAD